MRGSEEAPPVPIPIRAARTPRAKCCDFFSSTARINSARRTSLRLAEVRRIALAAQGFGSSGRARTGASALAAVVRKIGLVQIDSVNVLVRSHYLPAYSRRGTYDRSAFDALVYGRRRELFEYWGHEASLIPIATYPLLRWRMARARHYVGPWQGMATVARERPEFVETLRAAIAAGGPMSASDFEGARGKGSWWGWSEVKQALEYLFFAGVLCAAARRNSFERVYDLAERVIPKDIYTAPDIAEADAQRQLIHIAARALGVATESDLRDYFRLPVADARHRIGELVEAGLLHAVAVEGWKQVAYLDPERSAPRTVAASALLSPFDSLVWHRPRAVRLFDFDYRLEIYTPAHKRVHGYYVLPYLLDEALVARVDLKADRAASVLRVHAVSYEDKADRARVNSVLRDDLASLAAWLHLEHTALPRVMRERAVAGA